MWGHKCRLPEGALSRQHLPNTPKILPWGFSLTVGAPQLGGWSVAILLHPKWGSQGVGIWQGEGEENS